MTQNVTGIDYAAQTDDFAFAARPWLKDFGDYQNRRKVTKS